MSLRRFTHTRELAALDPARDYARMLRIMARHEFPLDLLLAGELAQLKTFAIPRISALLARTGQYQRQSVKRLDDTRAILTEIMEDGVEGPHGSQMVEHLNRIHGHYRIDNEDYLYTLSLFIFEPLRWLERHGWRQPTEAEREGLYQSFAALGRGMRITDIPPTRAAFAAWRDDYRLRMEAFAPSNMAVTEGAISGLRQLLPWPLRPLTRPLVKVLLDDPALLAALGLGRPSRLLGALVRLLLKGRALWLRRFNRWEYDSFQDSALARHYPSYPQGYQPFRLGPEKLIRLLERQEAA